MKLAALPASPRLQISPPSGRLLLGVLPARVWEPWQLELKPPQEVVLVWPLELEAQLPVVQLQAVRLAAQAVQPPLSVA